MAAARQPPPLWVRPWKELKLKTICNSSKNRARLPSNAVFALRIASRRPTKNGIRELEVSAVWNCVSVGRCKARP